MQRTKAIEGASEEESRTDASFRRERAEVPNLEAVFQEKQHLIKEDRLKHLLVPPKDEVKVIHAVDMCLHLSAASTVMLCCGWPRFTSVCTCTLLPTPTLCFLQVVLLFLYVLS